MTSQTARDDFGYLGNDRLYRGDMMAYLEALLIEKEKEILRLRSRIEYLQKLLDSSGISMH